MYCVTPGLGGGDTGQAGQTPASSHGETARAFRPRI